MRAIVLGLLLALGGASPALAHGFLVDLEWTGEVIRGEVFFSDGQPPAEGTWSVSRVGETASLGAGALDTSGHFSWRPPGAGRYRCEVREVGLHKASAEVEVPSSGTTAESSTAGTPGPDSERLYREQKGRRGWGKTRIKRLLTGLGGIALLGAGLYRFQRRRRERELELEDEDRSDSDQAS